MVITIKGVSILGHQKCLQGQNCFIINGELDAPHQYLVTKTQAAAMTNNALQKYAALFPSPQQFLPTQLITRMYFQTRHARLPSTKQ